jgi:hypothetical protein
MLFEIVFKTTSIDSYLHHLLHIIIKTIIIYLNHQRIVFEHIQIQSFVAIMKAPLKILLLFYISSYIFLFIS